MVESYVKLKLNNYEAYINADRLNYLKEVDAAIFDCDGVLTETRNSYNRAISKTVAYIINGLSRYRFPECLVSDEIIFLFRRSGGFNNDRDISYGISMFILCNLPSEFKKTLERCIRTNPWRSDPFERFILIKKMMRREFQPKHLGRDFFTGLMEELKKFTAMFDASGIQSVDRNLIGRSYASRNLGDFYDTLRRFIYHPGRVGESLVATIFEEFFCGPRLFKETYGVEPAFRKEPGMIENEKIIIKPETFDRLALLFGGAKFGISSGSAFKPAEYALGDLIKRLNPKALFFSDDIEKAEFEASMKEGSTVNLRKPNPYSLLKAAEALKPFKFAVYIGDSMEDFLMVEKAKQIDPRFLFIGVYRHSGIEDVILRGFLDANCDVILPSVNELPQVLEKVRRMEN